MLKKEGYDMLRIDAAVLHIFDTNTNEAVLSQTLLDHKEQYMIEYIDKMMTKIMYTAQQKVGKLPDRSPAKEILVGMNQSENFLHGTQKLTNRFFNFTKLNPDIKPADLLWTGFWLDEAYFIGMFKLNHNESYTHYVEYDQDNLKNDLIINRAILPSPTQAIDEGFLYCIDTEEYFLIEKKHLIEEYGERINYLSEIFLDIQTNPSMKESVNIIKKAIAKTAKKFGEDDYQDLAEVKQILHDTIHETQAIDNQAIAEVMYGDNFSRKQAYFEETKEQGLADETPYMPELLGNNMQRQKFKFENGIELSIPLDLFNDPEVVEIKNNPDGTLSVEIKNIEKIKNMF
ncbi:hypothetical protein A6J77_001870 [Aerococcus viridans]|uniref:Nucleoid-associated protein n=2 Tax=Aerococcus viridans TaxID=1377 RepID=A0A2J9PL49_9LACT|nr:hypothetical protein A6J77_001870 [Aerococcus viridans]